MRHRVAVRSDGTRLCRTMASFRSLRPAHPRPQAPLPLPLPLARSSLSRSRPLSRHFFRCLSHVRSHHSRAWRMPLASHHPSPHLSLSRRSLTTPHHTSPCLGGRRRRPSQRPHSLHLRRSYSRTVLSMPCSQPLRVSVSSRERHHPGPKTRTSTGRRARERHSDGSQHAALGPKKANARAAPSASFSQL